jgi:hypothetical protein
MRHVPRRWVNRWFEIFAGFLTYWEIMIAIYPGENYADPIIPCVFLTTIVGWPIWFLCHWVTMEYMRSVNARADSLIRRELREHERTNMWFTGALYGSTTECVEDVDPTYITHGHCLCDRHFTGRRRHHDCSAPNTAVH